MMEEEWEWGTGGKKRSQVTTGHPPIMGADGGTIIAKQSIISFSSSLSPSLI